MKILDDGRKRIDFSSGSKNEKSIKFYETKNRQQRECSLKPNENNKVVNLFILTSLYGGG